MTPPSSTASSAGVLGVRKNGGRHEREWYPMMKPLELPRFDLALGERSDREGKWAGLGESGGLYGYRSGGSKRFCSGGKGGGQVCRLKVACSSPPNS